MNKTGSQIWKGKAMLKRYTLNITISYRPYDLQGTSMPAAEKADRFIPACLIATGSSGYLKRGAFTRIPE